MTQMGWRFKASIVVTGISSLLIAFMIFSTKSIGSMNGFRGFLLMATRQGASESEVELPPIARKSSPWIIKSISLFFIADYTQTEGFVSMCRWNGRDGVTISLQHIWSTLALAMLINRTFILSPLPASASMGGANVFIPFTDLFDVNILRRSYGRSCCVSPTEVNQNILNFTRVEWDTYQLLREFKGNKSQLIKHKHIQVCGANFDFVSKMNMTSVYENTQPHPLLKKIIRSGSDLLHNRRTANTLCIHLRTEPEFINFFTRAPATYSREQILMKMNLTRNNLSNSNFAKLWSLNKNHRIKPILYLAGGDKRDAKPFFMKTGWFSNVYDKDSLLLTSNGQNMTFTKLLIKYNASSSLLNALQFEISTVLAVIDMEICKEADIFIGNNHSSLSERIASMRQRSNRWEGNRTRTLEGGGQYNYMVNGLARDASTSEDLSKLQPLHPFCAANSFLFMSYTCRYVRET
jgi:hypothetical protein